MGGEAGSTNDQCFYPDMEFYLDCYPCFLRQVLSAARRDGATEADQHGILLETMELLRALPAGPTPPVMADGIHRLVRARTAVPDPNREAKRLATAQALGPLPRLGELVRTAADPLETAVRIGTAGSGGWSGL